MYVSRIYVMLCITMLSMTIIPVLVKSFGSNNRSEGCNGCLLLKIGITASNTPRKTLEYKRPVPMRKAEIGIITASREGKLDTVIRLVRDEGIPTDYQVSEGGPTPLMTAASGGFVEIITFLLNPGPGIKPAEINKQDREHRTALSDAVLSNNADCVVLLMESGADPNLFSKNGWTPLYIAANKGYTEIAKTLLFQYGSNSPKKGISYHALNANTAIQNGAVGSVLMMACIQGHYEIVKILLESGADVNARDKHNWTALMKAADKGHVEVVELLLDNGADAAAEDNTGSSELMLAARAQKVEVAEALFLRSDVDVNARDDQNWTALMHAADKGHVEVVELLLDNGADAAAADNTGLSALMLAARAQKVEVVEALLLRSGVDVNARDKQNWTALMHAAVKGHVEVVELLLDNGADAAAADNTGFSALMLAANAQKTEVVEALLLRFGVDVNSVDKNGRTALTYAVLSDYHDVARLLCLNGADTKHIDRGGQTPLSAARSPAMVELLAFDYPTPAAVKNETASAGELKYAQIPRYLHSSALYKSLDEDGDHITIPDDCFKQTDAVGNLADFVLLLKVIQFWGLDAVPPGMCSYCAQISCSVWNVALQKTLDKQNTMSKDLLYVFESDLMFERAIEVGRDELVEFFTALGPPTYVGAMNAAARAGRLDYMQSFFARNYAWDTSTCAAAVSAGQLECLRYARDNGCVWEYSVYSCAIKYDQVECLNYAYESGLPWHVDVCIAAVRAGSVGYLHIVREKGCPWDDSLTLECAAEGEALCLEYALEHGCPVNRSSACRRAYDGNYFICLQLLQDASICVEAASRGDLPYLEYLHMNDCPWDEHTTEAAGVRGHEGVLRFAIESGCPHIPSLVAQTVGSGDINCVNFLVYEHGLFMDEDGSVFGAAFVRGDLLMMQYLVDAGCPYSNFIFLADERDRSLSQSEWDARLQACIIYAVERGWVPNPEIFEYASIQHLVFCSVYLHSRDAR